MEHQVADWIPIGSVIKVRNSDKKLMVIGVQQKKSKDDERVYDYAGVMYPEGYIGNRGIFVFDQEDIEKIAYLGFHDIERQLMLASIQKKLSEQDQE